MIKITVQTSCTIVRQNMIFWSDACIFLLKTKNQSINGQTSMMLDNNCNENRNKTRRDHDDTQACYQNNQLILKILAWFARGDCVPIGNQKNKFEL